MIIFISFISLIPLSSLTVGHLPDQPPERSPESPGWDELRDPVRVGLQHGPHQSCRCLAHGPGGTAVLETQHRDHCERGELKPRQTPKHRRTVQIARIKVVIR